MSIDEWFKEFGKNTTSNLELIKYCKKLKIDHVVLCMRDEFKNLSKYTKNIIMNFEENNGNSSHWVCIYNNQVKYYFDSNSLSPPVEVMKFLQNGVSQTFQVQYLNSKCCGQLCLYALFQLNKNKFLNDIIFNLIYVTCWKRWFYLWCIPRTGY